MRTVIIEDEPNALNFLTDSIQEHCPDLMIEGAAGTVTTAVQLLREKQPDLVFFDIKLGTGTGFEVLEKIGVHDFEIIYMTAYYGDPVIAAETWRFGGAALLPKPFTSTDLKQAVDKALKNFRKKMADQSTEIRKRQEHQRIVLRNQGSSVFLPLCEIAYCESDGAYVVFHFRDGRKKTVARSLAECDELLHENGFIRIHNSHLINTLCLQEYQPGKKGGAVILENNVELEISDTYREAFKKWLWSNNLNFER